MDCPRWRGYPACFAPRRCVPARPRRCVPRLDRLAGRAAADAELLEGSSSQELQLARLDGCLSRRGGPLKGTQIRARAARCMTAEPAERASELWRGPRERRAAMTCAPGARQRPKSFSWSCHRRAGPRGAAHERHHGRRQRGCSAGLEGGRTWRPRRHVLHEEPQGAEEGRRRDARNPQDRMLAAVLSNSVPLRRLAATGEAIPCRLSLRAHSNDRQDRGIGLTY